MDGDFILEKKLYFIDLDEKISFSKYIRHLHFISYAKKAKIDKIRNHNEKKRILISELFLRFLVCDILNLENKDLRFDIDFKGKPYLVNCESFHYNISHTRNAIVIVTSKTPIGVDVEKIKTNNTKAMDRFFSQNELNYIRKLDRACCQERGFCEVWTKKEAYLKWSGTGLTWPLPEFDTLNFEISKMLKTVRVKDYVISICYEDNENSIFVEILDENQMLDKLALMMPENPL